VNAQHSSLEIDIRIAQKECLGDTKSRAGDEAEKRLIDHTAHAPRRLEPSRGGQQIDDLMLAVDVRSQPLVQTAEDRVGGDLRAWFELLQPAGERTQMLKPARPGVGSRLPWLSRRAHSAMTSVVSEPRRPLACT